MAKSLLARLRYAERHFSSYSDAVLLQQRNAIRCGTMQQTISQAAKLYGKARSTIHRAIEAGRLSCSVRGDGVRVIDLAELIRVWGEPPPPQGVTQPNTPLLDVATQQALLDELRALREEMKALRDEVHELRRLPAPHQATPPTPPSKPSPTPPQDFGDLLARLESRTPSK